MSTETLSSESGRTVLRMRRELPHPVEKVWRAITEPKQLSGWFPAAVEAELRLDGPMVFSFPGEPGAPVALQTTGVIRAYDPPTLLEYTWGEELLRWELTPTDAGCTLHLTATYDDRPGSGSFAGGWTLCFDALQRVLGDTVPEQDYRELHEHFATVFGLDEGVLTEDGGVRFERQLVKPKETVWKVLCGAQPATAGTQPPSGFVAKGIEPGVVSKVEEPLELVYGWNGGEVSWTLRDGNGGARLVLTQTGPATDQLAAWHDLIESLAAELAG
ncbi:SRPBCC family protein [Kribbella solani]|uniref:SRPBCC family protein n=1 Tax=Kribbella solani TaxID=236067 RepID=UPI0029BC8349|nr:SRPBCC family protein [Kribbella solani]MDX3005378.1 SRPBCC family protein [Kribbella solani]